MRNTLVVSVIIGFFAVTFCPAISWSQDWGDGDHPLGGDFFPEDFNGSVTISSITPNDSYHLLAGDEIEMSVEVKYRNTEPPGFISLSIWAPGSKDGVDTFSEAGPEPWKREVVTNQEGTVTFRHKIVVPDTEFIRVTAALFPQGGGPTAATSWRRYKVVKKTDVKTWEIDGEQQIAEPQTLEQEAVPSRVAAQDKNLQGSVSMQALQESIEWSLWTFRSSAWNGYIDFQGNGRYWTHWGYGRWSVDPYDSTKIRMKNGYDIYSFSLTFDLGRMHYEGRRDDGVLVSGDVIFRRYDK